MQGSDASPTVPAAADESAEARVKLPGLSAFLRRDGAVLALRAVYFLSLCALLSGFIVGLPLRYRSLLPAAIGISLIENRQGDIVIRSDPGRPAHIAGVRSGDILVGVNGDQLSASEGISKALGLISESPETPLELLVMTNQGHMKRLTVMREGFPLEDFGITADVYALILVSVGVLFVLGFSVPALIIAARKSDERMAGLVSLTLILFAVLSSRAAGWIFFPSEIAVALTGATNLAVLLVLLLFPDGRFVPSWTRWFLLASGIWILIKTVPGPGGLVLIGDPIKVILDVVVFGVGISAQIHRYKKSSDLAARQQTKWLTFGFAVAFIAQFGYSVPRALFPIVRGSSDVGLTFELAGTTVNHLVLLVVPLSFTHAVLRHRLFDIDLIINRTLVYVPLSAILAGVYTSSVMLFRSLFVALTGESSDIAVIMSTLVIVATMTPIKDLLQDSVDRRFGDAALPIRTLRDFELQVRERIHAVQAAPIIRRLLDKSAKAFGAKGGAAFLGAENNRKLIHTCGKWTGVGGVEVQVCKPDECFGSISLGEREGGKAYSDSDLAVLRDLAETVATAIDEDRGL